MRIHSPIVALVSLLSLLTQNVSADRCQGLPGPFLTCFAGSNFTKVDQHDVQAIHRNISYRNFVPGAYYENRFFIMKPKPGPAGACYETTIMSDDTAVLKARLIAPATVAVTWSDIANAIIWQESGGLISCKHGGESIPRLISWDEYDSDAYKQRQWTQKGIVLVLERAQYD